MWKLCGLAVAMALIASAASAAELVPSCANITDGTKRIYCELEFLSRPGNESLMQRALPGIVQRRMGECEKLTDTSAQLGCKIDTGQIKDTLIGDSGPELACMWASGMASMHPDADGLVAFVRLCNKDQHDGCQTTRKKFQEAGLPTKDFACDDSLPPEQRKALEESEKSFVEAYKKKYEYVEPLERAASALGYSYKGEDMPDAVSSVGSELTRDARAKLKTFQSSAGLKATGFLDEKTFARLLEQPVDVKNFKIDRTNLDRPQPVGDWFFSRTDVSCAIWTKPVAITGKFLPDFNNIPVVKITRFTKEISSFAPRDVNGTAISQQYGANELYADADSVYLSAGAEIPLEDRGASIGPHLTSCEDGACYGDANPITALRDSTTFLIVGPSKLGGQLSISYSASGFVAAFRRLDSECGGGNLGTWLRH